MTAAKSGRFWAVADYLLAHQSSIAEQDLIAVAGRAGIDEAAFAQTLHEHRYAARVEADRQAGLGAARLDFAAGKYDHMPAG